MIAPLTLTFFLVLRQLCVYICVCVASIRRGMLSVVSCSLAVYSLIDRAGDSGMLATVGRPFEEASLFWFR